MGHGSHRSHRMECMWLLFMGGGCGDHSHPAECGCRHDDDDDSSDEGNSDDHDVINDDNNDDDNDDKQ